MSAIPPPQVAELFVKVQYTSSNIIPLPYCLAELLMKLQFPSKFTVVLYLAARAGNTFTQPSPTAAMLNPLTPEAQRYDTPLQYLQIWAQIYSNSGMSRANICNTHTHNHAYNNYVNLPYPRSLEIQHSEK